MELRHLRYFTAVAKHLNLSEASRRPDRHLGRGKHRGTNRQEPGRGNGSSR